MNRLNRYGTSLFAAIALVVGGSALAAAAPAATTDPHGTVVSQLRALPEGGMFADAFEQFGVASMFDANETYTIFVPTDASLQRAGMQFLSADDVLAYVVLGALTVEDLMARVDDDPDTGMFTVETLAGTEMTVEGRQANELVINGFAIVTMPGTTQQGANVVHVVEFEGAPADGVGGSDTNGAGTDGSDADGPDADGPDTDDADSDEDASGADGG